MNNCMGIINLDETERNMEDILENRTVASVPFGARYRLIDFVLSNMTNSGIENIGLFTKNESRSLLDHVGSGKPWDLARRVEGLRVFNFDAESPATNDIHNFYKNIEFFERSRAEYVLMSPSYMVCNIDYRDVIKKHIESGNDVTMIYKTVDNADKAFDDCDVLNIDENGMVVSIGRNIGRAKEANIGMEMYIMKKALFVDIVEKCMINGMYSKVKNFLRRNIGALAVGAYEFKGYLSCINSINSYYNANIDLLTKKVSKELFNKNRPIYTKTKSEAPTKYGKESCVTNSVVANGCRIDGEVKNSIIFRKVNIEKGAKLDGCVILQKSIIGKDAVLNKVITDKAMEIEKGSSFSGFGLKPYVINRE